MKLVPAGIKTSPGIGGNTRVENGRLGLGPAWALGQGLAWSMGLGLGPGSGLVHGPRPGPESSLVHGAHNVFQRCNKMRTLAPVEILARAVLGGTKRKKPLERRS